MKVGSRTRATFHGRESELRQITARLVGYAARGRCLVEVLDGALHPFALAIDNHPLMDHRAARAACDLVDTRAALDLASVAASIDGDALTRAVGELYRITSEGPLRLVAVTVLRMLVDQPSQTAGSNDIRSSLLARQDQTLVATMIGELIVPAGPPKGSRQL